MNALASNEYQTGKGWLENWRSSQRPLLSSFVLTQAWSYGCEQFSAESDLHPI
jgi:hypothetical protein